MVLYERNFLLDCMTSDPVKLLRHQCDDFLDIKPSARLGCLPSRSLAHLQLAVYLDDHLNQHRAQANANSSVLTCTHS
jgi:hypothetical protein